MTNELKKASVKSKVEAVIFSTGRRMHIDEICKLCKSKKEDVILALNELKSEYDQKQSSLMLAEDGEYWKFSIRDHLASVVRKIVTETELTKSVMETLAVIAFKYPIRQSDLIKIRTNKAYDHLGELESSGYITRQKHGRTNLIKLTDKFFRYFDLTEDKLRDRFKDFESIATAIKEKEIEVDKIKDDQRKKAEELKLQDEKIKQEIESLDDKDEEFEIPLETYDEKEDSKNKSSGTDNSPEIKKEIVGELEVFDEDSGNNAEIIQRPKKKGEKVAVKDFEVSEENDEAKEIENTESEAEEFTAESEDKPDDLPKIMKNSDENPNEVEGEEKDETKDVKPETFKGKKSSGIKLTPEMEKEIDRKN